MGPGGLPGLQNRVDGRKLVGGFDSLPPPPTSKNNISTLDAMSLLSVREVRRQSKRHSEKSHAVIQDAGGCGLDRFRTIAGNSKMTFKSMWQNDIRSSASSLVITVIS